jgi:hypothetical protein
MPIITSADLGTHIYPEVINEIIRNDSTIADKAVDAAIQETKMYLSRYDLLQLFGDDANPPTVQDEYLKSLAKDLACWHLLRLCNVKIDYASFRTLYEDAIKILRSIMAGEANPQGWPYYDASSETAPKGDTVNWNSNPKRVNYY